MTAEGLEEEPDASESIAVGVGIKDTVSDRRSRACPFPDVGSVTGVGSRPRDDEDAKPPVGRADVGRSKTEPLRIEPEVGQVPENCVDRTSNKSTLSVAETNRPLEGSM
ncbi:MULTISPECIES: hypothetical protein [Microbacterium]|uniref:hypothetical protein n=1 Tax=Microbacterium TaxID=33882 RepID=UPI0027D79D61|nr:MULTISPECIES: hypothetical protein [Microbacterium]